MNENEEYVATEKDIKNLNEYKASTKIWCENCKLFLGFLVGGIKNQDYAEKYTGNDLWQSGMRKKHPEQIASFCSRDCLEKFYRIEKFPVPVNEKEAKQK